MESPNKLPKLFKKTSDYTASSESLIKEKFSRKDLSLFYFKKTGHFKSYLHGLQEMSLK